jgi:hypothetical protein
MKVCSRCKIEQPLTAFHRDKSAKDGHVSACKTCWQVRDRSGHRFTTRPSMAERDNWYANGLKWCPHCTLLKPLHAFSTSIHRKYGLGRTMPEM